ncbi:MAG: 3-hydroxybutyrate dehydrogenase [Janthinobacterium sp.]|jgi:3-hydroxybutyrate dehydrogenase
MAPRYGLEGRVVLITGAAGGIGRALAAAFAAQGAQLVLVDRDADRLQSLANELATQLATQLTNPFAGQAEAMVLTCDLGDDNAVAGLAQVLEERCGRLDVLVNNAGTEYPGALSDAAFDAMARWSQLLENNVSSMVRLTRAVLPLLQPGSCIINQSSIWGKTGVAGFSAYVASKHAVIGLTRSLAWELGPRGIRVNAVCPGWIRTDAAMRSLREIALSAGRTEADVERELLSRQALPGMLAAADIAGVYLFLASEDARSLTGQSIVASNGEVMT